MASRSMSTWRAVWPATLFLAAALSPAAADPPTTRPPEEAASTAASRTVVVGKALLNWYLRPAKSATRPARVEAFRVATAAHLSGDEPINTRPSEPVHLPGGELGVALPAEMINTLFVDSDGRIYCSDSTVIAKASAAANGAVEK